MSNWRVGRIVPLNVYEGDRPICQCHTVEDAQRIVKAIDAVERLEAAMWCDACAGTGKVASADRCICGGSGRVDDAFRNLRVEHLRQEAERQSEITRLKAHLGAIAAECMKYNIDSPEIYHQCYMALVGNLSLPAFEQAEIMRLAIEAAQKESAK